jgi:L-arabinokinase
VIAAYVSGHGFGHATRVGEVLRAVRERSPRAPLLVVSAAPEALFRHAVPGAFTFRALRCDVGLIQSDALTIDEAATAVECRLSALLFRERVATEARWLRRSGVRVVLGDVPPLAFAAAAEAGVPSLGLANFSWDWIYRHLASRQPELAAAADQAAEAYGRADLLLELPFAGDLSAFPRREPIGLVARRPRVPRSLARDRLGLDRRPTVLVSFGGLGLPGLGADAVAGLDEFSFLWPQDLPAERLDALGLGYADVVCAVDVVLSKPGYGIVSDAIAAGTRLLYTDRGDFPEYPILVREMGQHLACGHVSQADLRQGRLREPLQRVLGLPLPDPPDLGGARRAAVRLLERV